MAFDPIRIERPEEVVDILNRVQDNLVAEFARILPFTLEGPTIVEDVVLGTTDLDVPHGLAQLPKGYLVSKRSASAIVFDGTTAATDTKKFISLTASAPVTVDIIFF